MQWASIMDRTAEAPCNPCVNPSLTSTCAAESPCDPCVNLSLTSTCAAPAALNGSTLLFSREEGEEGRGECVVGARGRTSHGRIAARSLCESLLPIPARLNSRAQRTHTAFSREGGRREERGVRGWRAWARPHGACRAQWKPTAKWARTTFSSPLSILYFALS